MNRQDAIRIVFRSILDDDLTVSTTGLISREIFSRFHSARNIYVPGSMGLVSSIGLGIALCVPEQRVIVIDGDASLLMNFGSLVTIGNLRPKNLLHIVLDNSAYGSCSEEPSMSGTARFDTVALTVGYTSVLTASTQNVFENGIKTFETGPSLILAKIVLGGRRDFDRPSDLVRIKQEFMRHVQLTHKGKHL